MILHGIGEHLLLRCQWTLEKLNEVGIPVHQRIEMMWRLSEALNLDVVWFHALSYVTDPEYLPLVVNQVKYLYFLKSKDSVDSRLIEFLFSEPLTHCPFMRHEHQLLFAVTSEKMREKCETLLKSYSASKTNSKGVKIRAHIERVWKEEQNTVKTSLETTLTKCYTRFKSMLEYQWERVKGYPATPGNDCYKEYRISLDGTIKLEEIESLTQHAPLLPPPLGDLIYSNQGSTPDTSIPPYQIPPSERKLSNVKQVVSKTVSDIANQIRSRTSSHSPSKENEEVDSEHEPSSQGNNLFEVGSTPGDKTELPTSNIQTLLTVCIDEAMAKYLPHLQLPSDGKQPELSSETGNGPVESVPEISRQTKDSNTDRPERPPRNSLEEPLPLTLNSVEPSTSYNLNILQNVLELEDKHVTSDEKQTDTAADPAEKKTKDQPSPPRKSSVPPLKGVRRRNTRKPLKERNSVPNKKPISPARNNKKKKPVSISPTRSNQTKKPIVPVRKSTRPRKAKASSPKPVIRMKNMHKKMCDDLTTKAQSSQTSFRIPTTTGQDTHTGFRFVQMIPGEAMASSTPITTSIERTCEVKPITGTEKGRTRRRRGGSGFSASDKKKRKTEEKEHVEHVVFNLVSEDEDDLYDPGDLSVDQDGGDGRYDSTISLINVPSQSQ